MSANHPATVWATRAVLVLLLSFIAITQEMRLDMIAERLAQLEGVCG